MLKTLTQRFAALVGITIVLYLACTPAMAKTANDPYQLMQEVADATFQRIANDQAQIARDANHLKVIVADELMPYIDHRYASKIILYKIKASKEQKKAFYTAFRKYLITTYATVFSKYSDQKVVFGPAKPFDGKSKVVVKTRLVSDGIPDISIDFRVRKIKKTGHWKTYDLRALGVSLLDSKRAELAGLLRQDDGVNRVTQLLTEKASSDIVIANEIGRL